MFGELIAVGMITIILGIAVIVWGFIKNMKNEEVYDGHNAKRNAIKNQAGALVR